MSDDDDWETDADFVNDLTEEQKRAFGNKETMQKYNATMGRGSLTAPPGSSQFEPATREAPHTRTLARPRARSLYSPSPKIPLPQSGRLVLPPLITTCPPAPHHCPPARLPAR